MSSVPQTGLAMERIKHYLTIMIIALLIPLMVSFIMWIVGSAFATGGGLAPGITYGIYQINSNNAGAFAGNMSSGVSYLWINSPANGGLASSPAFPSVMLTILNDLIVFMSITVAVFSGIELITALGAYVASSRY
ncbi:MAG: hypothetical protein ACP5LX_06905 [Nitrososphaeria archaeon]|jgi:hypothetical protein|nr:hypothetical protein [TACK group archaeon]